MIDSSKIVSQALMLVTREPLMSLEDIRRAESPSAKTALIFVSSAIRTVLEAFDWTFALKRKNISPSKIYTNDRDEYEREPELYTMQNLGWHTQYNLGNDFLGHLKVYNKDWSMTIDNLGKGARAPIWWIEGQKLCSNIPHKELNIEYVYYNLNEICIPAKVEMCMVYYLAHLMAPVLTGSYAANDQFYRLYNVELNTAKTSDYNKRYKMAMDNSSCYIG